ncbi:hypothetical protein QR680_017132 [Steinernema hermaphroditum]|uniref:Major facilitator superfamily (MFS) profile domain-containing protein n=1 Tax=Steinernema hermaphroditum TaxID=289476 RepID=A0AA39HFM3_9BILA|nr:hypothetical protein QR680_017132 [Steinernema hermaphroditum]
MAFQCDGVRFFVLIIATLCFSLFMADGAAFYSSLILMKDVKTSPLYSNDSAAVADYGSWNLPLAERRFDYSIVEESWLIGGLFVGVLSGVWPLTLLLHRHGPHRLLTGIGVSVTLLTAIAPFVASAGFPYLVLHRILHGFVLSNVSPILGIIIAKWSASSEMGLFLAFLTGHLQISMIISTPLAGSIGSRCGWPSMLFSHAFLSGVVTVAWAIFFRDDPADHPLTPYKKIFTSIPIWAVWVATFGNYIVSQFSITFFYMFLVSALDIDVETSGFLSAIPFAIQIVVKFAAGFISNRMDLLSELSKCRFFNSLAFYGAAFFFVVVAFVHPEDKLICALLAMVPQAMIGFNPGGFNKSSVLVARQHSPTVLAVTQVILCVTLFSGSFLVPFLAPSGTLQEYSAVFLVYAAVLFLTNTFFVVFCSVEPAEWTAEGDDSLAKEAI